MFHTDLTPFGVDMERLAKDRLARLQAAMKRDGLGALLLTDFLNIRYATNTVMMLGLRATGIQRFALIPARRRAADLSARAVAQEALSQPALRRLYVRHAPAGRHRRFRQPGGHWV